MADILRITTPLVNKNQEVQLKPGIDPTTPFQLQDISRVIQPNAQSEILKQNNGMIQQENPTILENLLKDPAVTAAYLKNIFMLEEIIKLLPANNRTVTEEIERMFQTLLVNPEDIAPEMKKQEQSSTAFRGELFNLLRQLSRQNPMKSDIQPVIANLLRALNHQIGNRDIRDAVANSLRYLAENLNSSKTLYPQLEELAQKFREPDAEKNFSSLKKEVLDLLQNVRDSVLFSPKLEKVVSITIYNLSRHNNSRTYLQEATAGLLRLLDRETRPKFQKALNEFLQMVKENPDREEASQVMKTLVDLVSTQSKENMSMTEQARVEKIIHSLLSSPCNFTPLLHFVIPVLFDNIRSFAEIWINPNSDERGESEPEKRGIHMLLVIDVEAMGRFEAELYVQEKRLDFFLFCPSGYEAIYSDIGSSLAKALRDTEYRLGEVRVEKLEHPRSLMGVFKSLPYRRTGVDVKI